MNNYTNCGKCHGVHINLTTKEIQETILFARELSKESYKLQKDKIKELILQYIFEEL